MTLLIAIVFAFSALVCYASCVVAARADEQAEKYRRKKNEHYE